MQPNNTSTLINELLNTVEVLGVEATSNILNNARKESLSLEDKGVGFVINMVCNSYGITVENLIKGRDRSVHRLNAMKFVIYYLRKNLKLKFPQIASLLHYDTSHICRKYEEMEELAKSKNNSLQRKFEKFNLAITEFQLNNQVK